MTSNGNSGTGIDLTLASGFIVHVKPLPPYYIDLIDNALPLPEFPMRHITLAAGDKADWPYEPPAQAVEPGHEDYALYVKWKSVEREREVIERKRDKARKDFLLANCVTVVEGPIDFDDDTWIDAVEAAFEDYEVPEHRGKRLLVFLKTQVIASTEELEIIIRCALSQEVSMQGILNALQGFRYKVEEGNTNGRHKQASKRKGRS